ncbi:hypothetical protein CDAR_378011 [Caerostris darwini]|uniref:Uncharacterized protein n=1 Tax=Caerostris darwini TaxID=1538125 RepID=A0AAV4PFX8_9ARAC|nr:hypothetical protein CDAR_378011 [Caerostris darwini]
MFYNVTICGSGILEEGEKLKKFGLECPQEVSQQSCLISKEKDKSVMAFFLLLGSIRDNLLRVTGGAILDEGEKLKKVGLECPQEVSEQSWLISKEKDKSVMTFFLLLGSLRDNPLKVTGGGTKNSLSENVQYFDMFCPLLKCKEKEIIT